METIVNLQGGKAANSNIEPACRCGRLDFANDIPNVEGNRKAPGIPARERDIVDTK
jgi:hypothetical protein